MQSIESLVGLLDQIGSEFLAQRASFTDFPAIRVLFASHGSETLVWGLRIGNQPTVVFEASLGILFPQEGESLVRAAVEGLVLVSILRPHLHLTLTQLGPLPSAWGNHHTLSSGPCLPGELLKLSQAVKRTPTFASKHLYASAVSPEQTRGLLATYYGIPLQNVQHFEEEGVAGDGCCYQTCFVATAPSPLKEDVISFVLDFNGSLGCECEVRAGLRELLDPFLGWLAKTFQIAQFSPLNSNSFFVSFQAQKARFFSREDPTLLSCFLKISARWGSSPRHPLSFGRFRRDFASFFHRSLQLAFERLKGIAELPLLDSRYEHNRRSVFQKELDQISELVLELDAQFGGVGLDQEHLLDQFEGSREEWLCKVKHLITKNLLKIDR